MAVSPCNKFEGYESITDPDKIEAGLLTAPTESNPILTNRRLASAVSLGILFQLHYKITIRNC